MKGKGYNKDILLAIASEYPITIAKVKKIYDITKSYDKTIRLIEESLLLGKDPLDMATYLLSLKVECDAVVFKVPTLEIPEEVFYNKDFCDAIRDCVKVSATNYSNALRWLKGSSDVNRDAEIIKSLANSGVNSDTITVVISALNKTT